MPGKTRWLWIAWVFNMDDASRELSQQLMICAEGPITSLGLPLPMSVIDALNHGRETGIQDAITTILAVELRIRNDRTRCKRECRKKSNAALKKFVGKAQLRVVQAPYHRGSARRHPRTSLANITDPAKKIMPRGWREYYAVVRNTDGTCSEKYHWHRRSYSNFEEIFLGLDETVPGLDLAEFKTWYVLLPVLRNLT
ncbi:hypothetical protein BDW74DRAFT_182785 [Aspergillus multicolor]|uniref:uncharacterized protein n=1 Tax=Aspergillus multicolor TaxID=41759 RepID=UPI003CCDA05C